VKSKTLANQGTKGTKPHREESKTAANQGTKGTKPHHGVGSVGFVPCQVEI
jgi:hypothetical protein